MSKHSTTEVFPQLTPHAHLGSKTSSNAKVTRSRRKSSSLGGDPRGDTGAGALATRHEAVTAISSPAPTGKGQQPGRKRKRTIPTRIYRRWARTSLRHTWLNPLILILAVLAAYFVSPGEQNPLHSALYLSYPNPPLNQRTSTLPAHIGHVTQYGKGSKDVAFVAFYTVVFSFTREFLMQRLIRPIAVYWGIRSRGKQSRFMEQFYTALYFAVFGPFGMWVMSRTPVWYFNTQGMYEGFPHRAHEVWFKLYYLLQASYWAQQGLVLLLQLEKPRKDFRELVLHHVITLSLIGLSYRFHFTYIGIAVYITHDISDFFLATSKILNYLDSSLTPPYFTFFLCVWAYLRHYINLTIFYSMLPRLNANPLHLFQWPTDGTPVLGLSQFSTVGPYELNWETQQYKCWISQGITFALLACLQAVNIFWFFLICRILWRFVFSTKLTDVRSDDEEEAEAATVALLEEKKANGEATMPQLLLNGEPVVPVSPIMEAQRGGIGAAGVEADGRKKSLRRKR